MLLLRKRLCCITILRLLFHWTGPGVFLFTCNRLELVRYESKIGPANKQVQYWNRSRPVPEWCPCKQKACPVRFSDRIHWICLHPVPCIASGCFTYFWDVRIKSYFRIKKKPLIGWIFRAAYSTWHFLGYATYMKYCFKQRLELLITF